LGGKVTDYNEVAIAKRDGWVEKSATHPALNRGKFTLFRKAALHQHDGDESARRVIAISDFQSDADRPALAG
jgi:hypothetical protein